MSNDEDLTLVNVKTAQDFLLFVSRFALITHDNTVFLRPQDIEIFLEILVEQYENWLMIRDGTIPLPHYGDSCEVVELAQHTRETPSEEETD